MLDLISCRMQMETALLLVAPYSNFLELVLFVAFLSHCDLYNDDYIGSLEHSFSKHDHETYQEIKGLHYVTRFWTKQASKQAPILYPIFICSSPSQRHICFFFLARAPNSFFVLFREHRPYFLVVGLASNVYVLSANILFFHL